MSPCLRAGFFSGSPKQYALCRRSAKGVGSTLPFAADVALVEAKPLAINSKKFFLRFPILAFAAHALAKDR